MRTPRGRPAPRRPCGPRPAACRATPACPRRRRGPDRGLRLFAHGRATARRAGFSKGTGGTEDMSAVEAVSLSTPAVSRRADALFDEHLAATYRQTDRLFGVLMLVQWAAAI